MASELSHWITGIPGSQGFYGALQHYQAPLLRLRVALCRAPHAGQASASALPPAPPLGHRVRRIFWPVGRWWRTGWQTPDVRPPANAWEALAQHHPTAFLWLNSLV